MSEQEKKQEKSQEKRETRQAIERGRATVANNPRLRKYLGKPLETRLPKR